MGDAGYKASNSRRRNGDGRHKGNNRWDTNKGNANGDEDEQCGERIIGNDNKMRRRGGDATEEE
jgi:hypothetical protein